MSIPMQQQLPPKTEPIVIGHYFCLECRNSTAIIEEEQIKCNKCGSNPIINKKFMGKPIKYNPFLQVES